MMAEVYLAHLLIRELVRRQRVERHDLDQLKWHVAEAEESEIPFPQGFCAHVLLRAELEAHLRAQPGVRVHAWDSPEHKAASGSAG